MFNNYNEDYMLPRGYENFSHQEMVSRSNRVLYENKDYVYRQDYCPSCMTKPIDCHSCNNSSKPQDKQIMFPQCEEPLSPYMQHQMAPKSTSPLNFVNDEQNLQYESKGSNQQHYPRYMYNEQNLYYDYPVERELRYGNPFVDREVLDRSSQQYYTTSNPSPTPSTSMTPSRGRVMSMEHNNYPVSRNSNEYRYMRNSQEYYSTEKNQIPKNEIEEITKDSLEWKNSENKNDKETTEDTNENHYEGLLDIKKTIKKDYNKKKWRKMTQDLFNQILDFEKKNPNIKQCEIEKLFLVNRSTYWRWKKRLLS